jgi:4-diphosphocytidyl-2-C-methyl-D-erythritol kinase
MSQPLTRTSPAKINLLLNVLGRREDGFHELETVMLPIPVADELSVRRGGEGVRLTCSNPELPTDSRNLVHRAATVFLERAGIHEGVSIHLEKRVPLESGMGGGSSNAATTLLLLDELFGGVLPAAALVELAAGLGSDVPFFLQRGPALARGRGERVAVLEPLPCLRGTALFLVHPGFGVSTPWAYRQLADFPGALKGEPGRAERLVATLRAGALAEAGAQFYNALEGPVHTKFPLLRLFREFLVKQRPLGTLMSGSGSATFALWPNEAAAREAAAAFGREFGDTFWTAVVSL